MFVENFVSFGFLFSGIFSEVGGLIPGCFRMIHSEPICFIVYIEEESQKSSGIH